MSKTCGICGGAIPDGKVPEGHTALCAEVARVSAVEKDRKKIAAYLIEWFRPVAPATIQEIAKNIVDGKYNAPHS